MAIEVKIIEMTIDGHPYTCPECGTAAFNLDGHGFIDAFPARGNCSAFHSWEDPLITVGDLKQINAVRTGRQQAEDVDTFEITIGGVVLAGILQPDVTLDDLKQVAKRVYWQRIIKPAARRRKRAAIRAVKRPIKTATGAASNAVAAAKAGALEAAWTAQAGGYQPDPDHTPEPINPCPACNGKGHHDIESRIHKTTKVRCTVCTGTGEID